MVVPPSRRRAHRNFSSRVSCCASSYDRWLAVRVPLRQNEERGPCRKTTRSPARTKCPPHPATPGDVAPKTAWKILSDTCRRDPRRRPHARRMELRRLARSRLVGKKPALIEWQVFPSMQVDPISSPRFRRAVADKDAPVLILCRSGVRSAAAAKAMTAAGYSTCLNVRTASKGRSIARGQARRVGGWKAIGIAMEANDEPNADAISGQSRSELSHKKMSRGPNEGRSAGQESWKRNWQRVCDRLRKEIGDKAFKTWFGEVELGELKAGKLRLYRRRASCATGSAVTMAIACWPIGRP